ncbi:C-terminal binding protein [Paenibacillus sp. GCM10027626]|uniref:C-terminal binding protein n=1 Tax=Paenibacillus sp. GCM10027626 TaxID=3273411 RepID=UPI00362F3D6F
MCEKKYKVVLTDADRFPLTEANRAALVEIGAEITETPYGMSEDAFAEACRDADAILVYSTKITSSLVSRMEKCKIIARCGTGYDNINVAAAVDRGIVVTYVPDYCIEEVSDHTVALMMDCWRRISKSNSRVKDGHWDNYQQLGTIHRIAGQKVGFLGFGRIAQAVARKLQGFHVHLQSYDPYASPANMHQVGVEAATFEQVIQSSDVLTLHTPLTEETRHFIDRSVLARMKPGAILINASRGELVNETDLIHALQSGHIALAGLDVCEQEPPLAHNPLLSMDNVVITPHSAAFSEEALIELNNLAVKEIIRKFNGLLPLAEVPFSVRPH